MAAFLAAEIPNSKEPIIKMNFHSFENKYLIIFQISKNKLPIVENIFENRYRYIPELKKMGAKAKIEGRTAVITGVRKLTASKVKSTDLRGGAGLVTAGLMARGKTTVTDIDYILRGYENLDTKLKKLGACIYKEEGE